MTSIRNNELLIFLFFIGALFSGCIEEMTTPENAQTGYPVVNITQETPAVTVVPDITVPTIPAPSVTPKSTTQYERFTSWIGTDGTNRHPYIFDDSKTYEEQYVCSHFTRDLIKNATDSGFEIYAVKLTGAAKGQNEWHMLAAVILDDNLYFVDPQTDRILKKEAMFQTYGYEYAYFGKDVYISRNNAEISMPVNYHKIIGLTGQNYIYLK